MPPPAPIILRIEYVKNSVPIAAAPLSITCQVISISGTIASAKAPPMAQVATRSVTLRRVLVVSSSVPLDVSMGVAARGGVSTAMSASLPIDHPTCGEIHQQSDDKQH